MGSLGIVKIQMAANPVTFLSKYQHPMLIYDRREYNLREYNLAFGVLFRITNQPNFQEYRREALQAPFLFLSLALNLANVYGGGGGISVIVNKCYWTCALNVMPFMSKNILRRLV